MSDSLKIYGTSFLLPGNRSWESLSSRYRLSFGDYGGSTTEFLDRTTLPHDKDMVVWVIFFEDVFSFSTLNDELSSENYKEKSLQLIDSFLLPLQNYLSYCKGQTLVAYSKMGLEIAPSPELARRTTIEQYVSYLLELRLLALRNEFPHFFLLPLDYAFSVKGVQSCFDSRNYYLTRCRLSSQGIATLADQITSVLNRLTNSRKKLLILDCDNTLWGEVLGEVGLEGIQIGQDGIGQAYRDFQLVIKNLSKRGILLALVSKNNQADVEEVLERHPGMILKKNDFVTLRINWKDKAENIEKISEELDLGLDSFVFWDDNPVERDLVKYALSEVDVLEPPLDVCAWPKWLRLYEGFSQFEFLEEDQKKIEHYKTRAHFKAGLQGQIDKKSYLKSIGMKPSIVEINSGTIDRAQQLCLKTNQFNVRTIRHAKEDIERILSMPNSVGFLCGLKDKFGDHGIVGCVLAWQLKIPSFFFLDTFLVSCRVIGRYFESWMLAQCVQRLSKNKIKYLVAEFVPTQKNQIATSFLIEHGFHPLSPEMARELKLEQEDDNISPDRAVYFEIDQRKFANIEIYPNE